jgi:hypothetical protein
LFNIKTIGIKLDWTRSKVRDYLKSWAGKLDKFKILDKDDKYSEVLLTESQYQTFYNWLLTLKKFKYSLNNQFGFDARSLWPNRHNHLIHGTTKTHNLMKKYGNDWLLTLSELPEEEQDYIMNEIFVKALMTTSTIRRKIVQSQKKFANDRMYFNKKKKK